MWGRNTAVCTHELTGHTYRYGVKHLARYWILLLSAAEDIRLWDVENGTCILIFDLNGTTVNSISVMSDIVVAACLDGVARVWNLENRYGPSSAFSRKLT